MYIMGENVSFLRDQNKYDNINYHKLSNTHTHTHTHTHTCARASRTRARPCINYICSYLHSQRGRNHLCLFPNQNTLHSWVTKEYPELLHMTRSRLLWSLHIPNGTAGVWVRDVCILGTARYMPSVWNSDGNMQNCWTVKYDHIIFFSKSTL